MEVGPATKMLTVYEIQHLFGLSPDEAEDFLKLLEVPILRTKRLKDSYVLALSLETALTIALLPGGPGLDLRERDPARAEELRDCLPSLPHWEIFREDPIKLQLLMSLASLMYGAHDEEALRRRLWALGDVIVAQSARQGRVRKKRKKNKKRKEGSDS